LLAARVAIVIESDVKDGYEIEHEECSHSLEIQAHLRYD